MSRHATSMKYFLSERYQDIVQARRFPETQAMFKELPANLRKMLFVESYSKALRAHSYFHKLSEECMADLCFAVTRAAFVILGGGDCM